MAKNRNYTDDYVYGREKIDPRLGRRSGGKVRTRKAVEDELTVISNHHQGYITHEQFDEIQKIIEINRPSQERQNMGCGTALLEGKLVRCATHGNHTLRVAYQVDRTGRARWCYYICGGEYLIGGDGCGSIAGSTLEPVIVQAVLDRISPPQLTVMQRIWKEAQDSEGDDQYRRVAELDRARKEVHKARQRCLAVDREKNPLVAEDYETLWEDAKKNLKKIESLAALPPSGTSVFTAATWKDFVELSQQRQALWDAPTTTIHDKKELIRTLVKAVIIDTLTRVAVRGRIIWDDGFPETHFDLPRRDAIRNQILQLAAEGMNAADIARYLNDRGLRNLQGRPWLTETIAARIQKLRRGAKDGIDRAA